MNLPDPATLGPVLREARTAAGLSQRATGRRMGISGTYVGQIEDGTAQNISYAVALDILRVAGELYVEAALARLNGAQMRRR